MTYPPQGPPPGWQPPPQGWHPERPPVPPIEPVIKPTNHVLHLILTVLTCLLWAPVWIIVAVLTNNSNNKLQAQYAQALRQYTQAQWAWDQKHRE